MGVFYRNRQTYTTRPAVKEILSETLTDTADTTIIAMVDTFVRIVIPEFADVAIVLRSMFTTLPTDCCGRLSMSTEHAQHVLRLRSIEVMIFYLIMAEATSIPFFARKAL
jgi:hypothetical protein